MSNQFVQNDYHKLFNKLRELDTRSDNESARVSQDKIYRKFVRDIVNNKINTKKYQNNRK